MIKIIISRIILPILIYEILVKKKCITHTHYIHMINYTWTESNMYIDESFLVYD